MPTPTLTGLYWGDFHIGTPAQGCRFTWQKNGVRNGANLITAYQYIVDVMDGMILGTSSSDVRTKMRDLEAMLSETTSDAQGQDLIYYLDDGSQSANKVLAADCLEGPYMDQLVWTPEQGAQFVTHRRFSCRFVFTVSILASSAELSVLTDFSETVTVSGGTPDFVIQTYLNSAPDRVNTTFQKAVTITQEGFAIGFKFLPAAPAPLYPADVKDNTVSYDSGKRRGNQIYDRKRTWRYVMQRTSLPSLELGYLWNTTGLTMPSTPSV